MTVRNLTDPVVHPKVGQAVCEQNGRSSDTLRSHVQRANGKKETDVAERNKRRLRGSEHVGGGVQMTLLVGRGGSSLFRDQTLWTGARVHENVRWPAKDLVEDQGSNGDNRGISSRVVNDFLQEGGVGLGFGLAVRHKDGVFLHVIVVAVMTCVAEFPAEKGNHQDTVQEPACDSIDGKIGRKGVVAAIMRKDPETSEEATLNETVESP